MWSVFVICVCLCVAVFQESSAERPPDPDDLLKVHTYQLGSVNDVIDGLAKEFYGHDAMNMIEFVRIEYYEDEGVKYLRCVGFEYTDKPCNCPETPPIGTHTVVDYPFDPEEYVREVRGNFYLNIGAIWFKTSKNKIIGPYGTETDPDKMSFKASYNGAPLLFGDGLRGLWVYNLNFSFHDSDVDDLEGIANEVADLVYEAVKGTITDIFEIRDDYWRMLPDVARKGCVLWEDDQKEEYMWACDLQVLLDQVNILTSNSKALREHDRRNLVFYKDFDTSKYLEQVQDAKNFHALVTGIKFDLQTVINVTEQQSRELNNYFKAIAKADIDIAEKDWEYIKGAIEDRQEGAAECLSTIDRRFRQILGVGISMASMKLIEEAFQFGTIMAANMNPFKLLFGGPDFGEIFEAMDNLLAAVDVWGKLVALLARLNEFVAFSEEVLIGFQKNMEQIQQMEKLMDVLVNETDPEIVGKHADEYVRLYGAYTPAVTEQQIMYGTALLGAVADESCTICGSFTGTIDSILGMGYESATMDCQFIKADIAVLESFFSDVYTLQFEMIDALTSIVKGTIALANAGRIGDIGTTIDVRTAAIGTAMLETKYQGASLGRCNVLEYIEAGKRPDICKKLLFLGNDIEQLIAYRGSVHKSPWYSFALLPIVHDSDNPNIPHINITNLLRGEFQTIRLPSSNKTWLQTYGWLPSNYEPESTFYYTGLELYIPGVKCNETGTAVKTVRVRSLSQSPVDLYSEEAPPKYNTDKHLTLFEYKEPADGPCPGFKQDFPIYDSETMEQVNETTVCVTSPGTVTEDQYDDYMYPSGYNSWTMWVLSQDQCTLVVDEDIGFKPMATVRLMMRQVFVKKDPNDPGIDHCWPERCEPHEFCVNEPLSYRCQGPTRHKSPACKGGAEKMMF